MDSLHTWWGRLWPVLGLSVALLALTGCPEGSAEEDEDGEVVVPELIEFVAEPEQITAGELSTLSWRLTDVSVVTITNDQGVIEQVFRNDEAESGSLEVGPTRTTTYTLEAINIGSSGARSDVLSASVTVTVDNQPARPTVELELEPQMIVQGEEATLRWTSTDAETLSLTANGEPVELPAEALPEGSLTVSPAETTTFVMVATGGGEEVSAEATLTVVAPPVIDTFEADPTAINEGDGATLQWTIQGATRIEISDGDGLLMVAGKDPQSDSLEVNPTETTTYTLTAENGAGQVSAEATVEVRPAPAIQSFTAEPELIARGQATTLSFTTTNATQIRILIGEEALEIGEVDPSGDSVQASPEVTTTFRLEATGPGGTVASEVNVEVVDPVIIDRFVAEPSLINLGETTTLRWETSGAEAVEVRDPEGNLIEIDGAQVDGEAVVLPVATGAWTLRATGLGGEATAQAQVTVDDSARVSLTVEPEVIDEGASATLSWQNIAVDQITLTAQPGPSPDITGKSPLVDLIEVSPTVTTTYTINGVGPNGEASAQVTLQVNPAVEIVSFQASAQEVLVGTGVTLSWEVANASGVTLSDGQTTDEVPTAGETVIEALEAETTFTLRAEGVGGPVEATVTVAVREPAPPQITRFVVTPAEGSRDDSTQLSWEISDATGISIQGFPVIGQPFRVPLEGQQPQAGSLTLQPVVTTRYLLSATNDEGQTDAEATFTVPLDIIELTATPTAVELGQSVIIDFRVQGATEVAANFANQGQLGENVPLTFDEDGRGSFPIESILENTVVTLTATDGVRLVQRSVEVGLLPPVIESFTVTPNELALGIPALLQWATVGATQVQIFATEQGLDEILAVQTEQGSGQIELIPRRSTVWRLVASNASGSVENTIAATMPLAILELTGGGQVELGGGAPVGFRVQGQSRVEVRIGAEGDFFEVPVSDNGTGEVLVDGIVASTPVTLRAFDAEENFVEETTVIELLPPTILRFLATNDALEPGQSTSLVWATQNATQLRLEALVDGLDPVEIDISEFGNEDAEFFITPQVTTTFRLTASNDTGEAVQEVLVINQLFVFVFAEPAEVFAGGGSTVLMQIGGALSATIQIDDNAPEPLELGGEGIFELPFENIQADFVVTVEAIGPGGEQAIETTSVTVRAPEIVAFNVTPGELEVGAPVLIDWLVDGAQELRLISINSRGQELEFDLSNADRVQDIIEVDVRLTTTFTLIATSVGGSSEAIGQVTVLSEPDPAVILFFGNEINFTEPFGSIFVSWGADNALTGRLLHFTAQGQLVSEEILSPDELAEGGREFTDLRQDALLRFEVTGPDGVPVFEDFFVDMIGSPENLRLSEIFYDAAGGDDGLEWIELYNAGNFGIDMGRVLIGYGGGNFFNATETLPEFELPPGGCVVIGGPISNDLNGNPRIDVELNFTPDIQNAGARADGVAIYDLFSEFDPTSPPIDAVLYGELVQDGDIFPQPGNGDLFTAPLVVDAIEGNSIYRWLDPFGQFGEFFNPSWFELGTPTPGRCFGLPELQLVEGVDNQLFEGRRRGPESGGNRVTLATSHGVNGTNTQVFFGEAQAECFVEEIGLTCFVPAGEGVVDLTLRQESGDVVYPGFYTYEQVDFCNIQFPDVFEIQAGDEISVFGRIFEQGVTEAPGANPDVIAEWGFGPLGSDPALEANLWSFFPATFNVQAGNDDEYMVTLPAPAAGEYSYVFRFRLADGAVETYCDTNGTVNNNVELNNLFNPQDAGLLFTFDP